MQMAAIVLYIITSLLKIQPNSIAFIPSVKIVSVDSDTSDSISDDESITKKLDFYEAKMDLYKSHMTPKSEPNTLAHKKIYEEDNDFEAALMTTSNGL